jgi:ubiquinone biosynthesis protein UbiJ
VNATTRQPDPVLARLGSLLQAVLGRAVALDSSTQEALRALEGRRVGVQLRGIDLAMAISVDNGKLIVGPHWQKPVDLNMHASPASLLAFALRRGDSAPLPPGRVDISGDAELARRLEQLLRDFRPDLEEAFAQTFGDVFGVALARMLQRAFAWTGATARTLAQDGAEYLREESRDLIAPAEMEQFLDDADALRERADRLDKRVQRLAQRSPGDAA